MEVDVFNPDKIKVMIHMADRYSHSGLIPDQLKGKPADILIMLQMGNEMGLMPMQSLQMLDVIKGKPSLKPQGMIALIRQKYPDALIDIQSDQEKITAQCTMARHQDDKHPYTSKWDISRATKMNYMHKPQYKSQPVNMFEWRAISDCARKVFPEVILGLFTEDELESFDNKPSPQIKKEPIVIQDEVIEAEKAVIESNELKKNAFLCKEICGLSAILVKDFDEDEKKMFLVEILEVEDILKDLPKKEIHELENLKTELEKQVDEQKKELEIKQEVKPSFKLNEKIIVSKDENENQEQEIITQDCEKNTHSDE